MYWRHDNGNQARVLSDKSLRYGFDFFLDSGVPKTRGYQRIAAYLWGRYGSRYFQQPKPQVMPFSGYAKLCYPATFAYEGYDVVKNPVNHWPETRQRQGHPELATWQQWDEKGVPMGGLRLSAPQWYQFLYNTAWWNNACDATGIYSWGKRSGDTSLMDKARRIVNFTLSAPQRGNSRPYTTSTRRRGYPVCGHRRCKTMTRIKRPPISTGIMGSIKQHRQAYRRLPVAIPEDLRRQSGHFALCPAVCGLSDRALAAKRLCPGLVLAKPGAIAESEMECRRRGACMGAERAL